MKGANTKTKDAIILQFIKDTITNYWYLFIITLVIGLIGAYLTNNFMKPVYEVSSIILINDNSKNNGLSETGINTKTRLTLPNNSNIFQNEIIVLQSSELMFDALRDLHMNVAYYRKKRFVKYDIYGASPYTVVTDTLHRQLTGMDFKLTPLSLKKFRLQASGKNLQTYDYINNIVVDRVKTFNFEGTYEFDQPIVSDYYSFIVKRNTNNATDLKENFYFIFNNLKNLSLSYQDMLTVKAINKDVSAAKIVLKTTHPQKGIDVVNSLIYAYFKKNLFKKNFIALNTIEYIDNQLSNIQDSLSYTEKNLQNFRTFNQVMDINSKANRLYDVAKDLETQKNLLVNKERYYKYINAYLQKNKDVADILVPSSLGIDDQVLSKIIEQMVTINNERNSLLKNGQEKNPRYSYLVGQIENFKNDLSENLKYLINTNEVALNTIQERLRLVNIEIVKLPGTERKLVGIERKFKLNDQIYTFLLEKRAEAQIAKASNIPDYEIIEAPKLTSSLPIFPNKTLSYAVAMVIALLLPFIFAKTKDLLNENIKNEDELKDLISFPYLGSIAHHTDKESAIAISLENQSVISESFRSIRTNLDFFIQNKTHQLFLVTSTLSREGKSFCALNIALSLSLLERRTILIDFDLRKPSLHEHFKNDNSFGLSSYLINKANLEEIIIKTDNPNLQFIPAGPMPPNPLELIGSGKTTFLINHLIEKYDYVILDATPLGLFSDAFLLMNLSNLNIFVTRQDYTPRKAMENVLTNLEEKKIQNITILLNDVAKNDSMYNYVNSYYKKNYKNN
jgi:tyrosine-protein kinase Etk/Wzc